VGRADKESAVAQHKHAVGRPKPGNGDSGHGSFEGGWARTFGVCVRCHFFFEDLEVEDPDFCESWIYKKKIEKQKSFRE
jgi:hypothetical protein